MRCRRALLVALAAAAVALPLRVGLQVAFPAEGAIAVTHSLGGGWGVTIRCRPYHEKPPILRRSIDVHEAVHLELGTWRLPWCVGGDEGERRAYAAMLPVLAEQRAAAGASGDRAAVELLDRWEHGFVRPQLRAFGGDP